ncbi:MAG: YbbR-like domain-containing protein [Bacteroidales bacterium]|nr:YbbR-like domain-containing protein [Bacteroidales bacterium]
MKTFFQKLLNTLNINGRELPVFLLSLLLAFSIWLIHNLSLRYNDFIKVSIVARCNIEGHSALSSNRCDVVVRGRTTGFNIMKFKTAGKNSYVEVPFSRMHQKDAEVFYVTPAELQEYTPMIFGEDVNLEYYLTDTLFFRFPFETFKRVPVRLVHDFEFDSQYTLIGSLEVEPDSITIYGEPYRLEKIEYAYTEPVKLSGLNADVHSVAKLERIRDIRFSVESVKYSIDVVRYVEITDIVNISVRNVPAGREMTVYPSSAKVTYHCVFPYRENLVHDIDFYVDYNDFISSRSGKCLVQAGSLPQGIISYMLDPQVVDCVIGDR